MPDAVQSQPEVETPWVVRQIPVMNMTSTPPRTPQDVTNDIILAVRTGYHDQLFVHNNRFVYIPPDGRETFDENDPAPLRPVTADLLSALVQDCAVMVTRVPGKPPKYDPVPERTVREILAIAPSAWRDRNLVGFVDAPYLAADGRLVTAQGYDEITGYFNRHHGKLTQPDSETIRMVLHKVFAEWYPFGQDEAGSASIAHSIGMHLTPLVRPAIRNSTPAFLIVAHKQGMGKTELASQPIVIAHGVRPAVSELKADVDAYQLESLLKDSPAYLVFDNAARGVTIGNPALEMAITSGKTAARLVGTGGSTILRVRPLWIFTGNLVECSTDMARRTIEMRFTLEGELESKPIWEAASRNGTPNAITWIEQNRDLVLSVLMACIQQWIDRGRPRPTEARIEQTFAEWSNIVGGIVGVMGDMLNLPLADAWLSVRPKSSTATGWNTAIEEWPISTGSTKFMPLTSGDVVEHLRRLDMVSGIFPGDNRENLKDRAGKHIANLSRNLTEVAPGWYLASQQDRKLKQRVYWPAEIDKD
jgi:hypothetical protein